MNIDILNLRAGFEGRKVYGSEAQPEAHLELRPPSDYAR